MLTYVLAISEFVPMQKAYLGGMRLERLRVFVPEFSIRELYLPPHGAIPHRSLELNPGRFHILGLSSPHESRERETYFPT